MSTFLQADTLPAESTSPGWNKEVRRRYGEGYSGYKNKHSGHIMSIIRGEIFVRYIDRGAASPIG